MARTLKPGADGGEQKEKSRANFDKDAAVAFYQRYANLSASFDSHAGEYRSDVKELYNEGANDLGLSRRIMGMEFKRIRAEQKRLKRENELEPEEKEGLENLRDALGEFADTPLGRAATGEDE